MMKRTTPRRLQAEADFASYATTLQQIQKTNGVKVDTTAELRERWDGWSPGRRGAALSSVLTHATIARLATIAGNAWRS